VNPAVLSLIPITGKNLSSPALGGRGAPATSSANAGLFRGQLSRSISKTVSGGATVDPSILVNPTGEALSATLERKIAAALAAGKSSSDVATQLAASLANSIATKLGATSPNARAQLQSAFASALSPPGQTGPPQTTAEQARTLAQRFAVIASIATGVSGSESGQLNRFVGPVLDAKSARANPAPTTSALPIQANTATADSVIREAISALTNVVTSTLALPPAATGDGKVVPLPLATQAVATGGDTPIGRILARAAVSGNNLARPLPVGTSPAISSPATPPSQISKPETVVATFLRAFTSAVNSPALATTLGKPSLTSGDLANLLAPTPPAHAFVPALVPVASPLPADVTNGVQSAPAPPPAPPAPVDANAIVDQLLRGISLRTLGSSSEIRLRLVPEQLGDLNVKLTVSAGNVSAHIVAQNADVHGALVAGQAQLSRSLADAGLKLSSFTVDVSGGGLGGNPQQQNGQPASSGTRRHLIDGVQTGESDESELLAAPSFAPPSAASASPGALNYLV
jgi:flagellar hook-length control protein FliK